MAPPKEEPMASKVYLTGKQTGMGAKLLKRLREERRIEFLPPGVMGRGYCYEESSYLKYLESQAVKAKPPELPFESLKKEVTTSFNSIKGGANMSRKWVKEPSGRLRHQGHGFSLIKDPKKKLGFQYSLDIRHPRRTTLGLRRLAGRPIVDDGDALNVAYKIVTDRFTQLAAAHSPDITFSQMIPIFEDDLIRRKAKSAKEVITRIRTDMEPHFGKMKLIEIELYPHIEAYRNKRQDAGLKDSSIITELAHGRALFTKARRRGLIKCQNLFEGFIAEFGLEVKRRTRWMTVEEQERLWPELAKAPPLDKLATFELNLLGRPHNILELKWKQVSWGNGSGETANITIPREQFKGKRDVVFSINPVNMQILKLLYEENPNGPDDFVFLRGDSKGSLIPIKRSWYQQEWRLACKRAGIKDLRFYDLKRTAGTRLVASGTTTLQLKNMMNHAQVSSTEIYSGSDIKACAKELEAKMAILNGGMNL